MRLGSGYWSLKTLKRRREARRKQMKRLDLMIERAKSIPVVARITPSQRIARFRRVLRLREAGGKSYREIAQALGLSAIRALRIYADAVNWRLRERNGKDKKHSGR